ncbi:endo-1,4-beta-xylanase [Microvirga sp. HBU67558]|uniref:endo-1,4-beta-xylanase n=1 Tax=Microvirga TaxID=186650 RepID=UPI001B386F26|nr:MULTISPECIES: endo-1,4-beta-xylanase [unclassified Microvirga]MBQ0820753.1 endo-1,4-beta-xylanase [Microvirga sp. HBU67558]
MTQHGLSRDGLSSAAVHRDLLFGTALCTSDLSLQPLQRAILKNCNIITAEYEMKWDVIGADPHRPDYSAADRLVDFAADNGLAFHGHTLWWHEAVPTACRESPDRRFKASALRHLEATVARYAGRLKSWDVINEPLEPSQGRGDGLRRSRFLEVLGPDYLATAFRRAADLDPAALLVLNEMGLEYDSREAEMKRRMMLRLLERELGRGTPIGGLGIQSHLTALEQPREHPELQAFLREIGRMGLSVMITELDVSDHLCPRDRKRRDSIVADTYRAYLDLVLAEGSVCAVNTWGLSDGSTWLNGFRPRADGTPQRPLLYDRGLRRKPAWHAVRDALGHARAGPAPGA